MVLATALFAQQGGLFTGGGPILLHYHLLMLVVVGVFTFGGSWIFVPDYQLYCAHPGKC